MARLFSLSVRSPKQALPRFHATKDALLMMWSRDKSCKWVHKVVEARTMTQKRSDNSQHGHGTIYEVAKELNLKMDVPEQKSVLEAIVDQLPFDHDWDDRVPLERGYKAAGLKRYRLDKQGWSTVSLEESTGTTVSKEKDRAHKDDAKKMVTDATVKGEVDEDKEWGQWLDLMKKCKRDSTQIDKLHNVVRKHEMMFAAMAPKEDENREGLQLNSGFQRLQSPQYIQAPQPPRMLDPRSPSLATSM